MTDRDIELSIIEGKIEYRVNARLNFIVLTFMVVLIVFAIILGAIALFNAQSVIEVRKNTEQIILLRNERYTVSTMEQVRNCVYNQMFVDTTLRDNPQAFKMLMDRLTQKGVLPCP